MKPGPRIITLANQKGGVGKTTTAINLATALAAIGERVLIVDLDPQGNASTGLGINRRERSVSSYDVLTGALTLDEAAMPTAVPGLSIVPSTLDLLGIEMEIAGSPDRVLRLRNAVHASANRSAAFTYILIDCPPSLNLLTLNSMAAADSVLVPLQPEYFALDGLSRFSETIELVREHGNPRLRLEGILLTMYDARLTLAREVEAEAHGFFGGKVFRTRIPRNVRLAEAPSFGMPALLYDAGSPGAQAYLSLAREIMDAGLPTGAEVWTRPRGRTVGAGA